MSSCTRIGPDLREVEVEEDFDDGYDDEWACSWCGGEGFNDDPDWDEWDGEHYPPCRCCAGTGLRKHQTIF